MDDSIVLTGISGRFPESDNVQEFWDNLKSGEILYKPPLERHPNKLRDKPTRIGKIKDLHKFDNDFFGQNKHDANDMGPQARMLYEVTYEALYDAGLDPKNLKGTKVAFFLGTSGGDGGYDVYDDDHLREPYMTYISSRMSYYFDWKGASFSVDTACAATIDNLVQAYYHLKHNLCDLVIVAGANTINDPFINRCLADLHLLSPTGYERCLDANADGFIRSECVAAIVVQRKCDAKRIYGQILGASVNNDGYTEEGITYPNRYAQTMAMKCALKESSIVPDLIDYIEAHITGTQAGDAVETSAIMDAYRKESDKKIRIGCVKSNIGHGEATAGSIAFIKACKILQTGEITPNAAYNTPNSNIEGLIKGQIVPIVRQESLNNDVIGVNTFGFGGCNGHVILRRNMKNVIKFDDEQLILFNLCNRTDLGVQKMVNYLHFNCHQLSRDICTLLNDVCNKSVEEDGFNYRSFLIANLKKGIIVKSEIKILHKRQKLCLIIDSANQLPAKDVLRVNFIHQIMKGNNKLYTLEESKMFQKLLSELKSLSSSSSSSKNYTLWQLLLIDLFKKLGLQVDIVAAFNEVKSLARYFCSKESVKKVLQETEKSNKLGENKKSGKIMQNNSIHKILDNFANHFIHFSSQIDKHSINENDWLIVTISDRIMVHGSSNYNPDEQQLNELNLLTNLGKLYLSGNNLDLSVLYQLIEYPVGRECATISDFIEWNHANNHFARVDYTKYAMSMSGSAYTIDLTDPEFEEIAHHIFDDKIIMPAAAYIYLIWKHSCEVVYGSLKDYKNVAFKAWKIQFMQTLPIVGGTIELHAKYNQSTHQFVISYNKVACATGYIKLCLKSNFDFDFYMDHIESHLDLQEFGSERFYISCQVQGFRYGPKLQNLISSSIDLSYARIKYQASLIGLLDSMIQVAGLSSGRRCPRCPVSIEELIYEPEILNEFIDGNCMEDEFPVLDVSIDQTLQTLTTYGLCMKGLKLMILPQKIEHPDLHYFRQQFFPLHYQLLQSSNYPVINRYLSTCRQACYNKEDNLNTSNDNFSYDDEEKYTLLYFIRENIGPLLEGKKVSSIEWDQLLESKQSILNQDFSIDCLAISVLSSFTNILESDMFKKLIKAVVMGHECDRFSGYLTNSLLKWAIATEITVQLNASTSFPTKKNDEEKKPKSNDLCLFIDSSLTLLPVDGQLKCDYEQFQFDFMAVDEGKSLVILLRDHVMMIEDIILQKMDKKSASLADRSRKLINYVQSLNFIQIASGYHKESGIKAILFKKKITQPLESVKFINISATNCEWVEEVQCAMEDAEIKKVWLVASDSYVNGLIGFAKCVRFEPFGDKIRAILWPGHELNESSPEMDEIANRDMTINICIDDNWGLFHLIPTDLDYETTANNVDCYVDCKKKGDLTTLSWYKHVAPEVRGGSAISGSGFSEDVKVAYSALNFRDILLASGRLSSEVYPANNVDTLIGSEFSGTTLSGKKVMGICRGQGIGSKIFKDNICTLFDVPDNLSLRDAATIPNVYMTVFYALIVRGNLQPGESVLIHAGCGGVGQAAINLCLSMNCQVFTTVGSVEKRIFLQRRFPQLKENCIANSRSADFEIDILRQTNSRGVDVVLNSLIEDKLQAGIRCLADGGRFLELGKHDIVSDSKLDTIIMPENTSFHAICLSYVISRICSNEPEGQVLLKRFTDFISNGLANGQVKPIFSHVFEPEKVEDAFRFMAKSKHLGKVLIKVNDDDGDKSVTSIPPCIMRTHFYHHKSYIIVGGLGGMGLELAYWMVTRGAKNIIITTRNGFKSDSERAFVEYLRNYCDEHRNIVVSINDCITSRFVQQLLDTGNRLAPIGGIFNLAMVLNDGLFENQSEETFEKVCAPKVHISNNLDKLSREMCPQLDYFVCFSSISTLGSIGQSNYGLANSFMERLCEQRHREGLPALAVQWGPVADVGVAARLAEEKDLNILGFVGQNILSCFNALDKFLQMDSPVCQSCVISNEATSVPKFDDLFQRMAHILGIKDFASLDPATTLSELGLDSLQSAEMRQYFERQYDLPLGDKPIGSYKISDIREFAEKLSQKGALKEVKLD